MKILAIEFSSPQRSVAVVEGSTDFSAGAAPRIAGHEVLETGPVSTRPLGMTEEVLTQARLEREQIEVLAVGLGPGSYTGIRAAIAVAQGWQLARGVKLLGLSSAECIAAAAQAHGLAAEIAVVIDAQRGEFYLARYEVRPSDYHEIQPLRLVSAAEVQAVARAGARLVGPEANRWFPDAQVIFPRAEVLGRLALNRSDFVPGENLEPIYLREIKFVKAPPPRILPGS